MGDTSINKIKAAIGFLTGLVPGSVMVFVSQHKKKLSILFSICILVLIIKLAGPDKMISAFRELDPKYFLMALFVYIGTVMLSALRWSSLIRIVSKPVHCFSTFQLLMIDKLANAFFPTSAVGITARTLLLHKKHDIRPSKGFATILLDYGFEMFASLLLGLPIIFLMHSKLSFTASGTLDLCVLLLGLGTLGVIVINHPKVSRRLERIQDTTEGNSVVHRFTRHRLGTKVMEFLSSFKVVTEYPFTSLNTIALSVLIKLAEAFRLLLVFKAFGIALPFYHFLLFEIVWVMFSLFAFTPGGIGTAESGKIAIFSMVPSVSASAATPVVFVDRFITFWIMLFIGAFFLLFSHKQYLLDEGSDYMEILRQDGGDGRIPSTVNG